jgi:hypothetical protein
MKNIPPHNQPFVLLSIVSLAVAVAVSICYLVQDNPYDAKAAVVSGALFAYTTIWFSLITPPRTDP